MKYRYTITHEGIVDADDDRDAEGVALWKAENGLSTITEVQVEPVREDGDGSN